MEKIASFMLSQTSGFITLPEEARQKIISYALARLIPNFKVNKETRMDFMVFDPECLENVREDQGRTLRVVNPWTNQKIYAKVDDFGDPAEWDELYEPEVAEELRIAPNCQFVITLMFAEEY